MLTIKDFFSKDAMILDLQVANKVAALKAIAHHLFTHHFITNEKQFFKALQVREKQFSTGIGRGIAIPHAQNQVVASNIILIARAQPKISWAASDQQPVDLIFAIALRDQDAGQQVAILQQLAQLMMDQKTMDHIRALKSKDAIMAFMTRQ